MKLIILKDNSDDSEYGVLICKNEEITVERIQDAINDLKVCLEDWHVEDIIDRLPKDWNVSLHKAEECFI